MKNPYDIIRSNRVTEKASTLAEKHNQYVFEVDNQATKQDIAYAVKTLFNKTVERVNTLRVKGKVKLHRGRLGRQVNWKKAIVTLKEGEKLDLI